MTIEDQCCELSAELEKVRAIRIAEDVSELPIGGKLSGIPTPFEVGYQIACEEIIYRLKTEEWVIDLSGNPIYKNKYK